MRLVMILQRLTLLSCVLPAFALAQPVAPTGAPAPAPAVNAKVAQELAEKHFCTGCHQMDMKVVGPGLKQIAAKYRNDKDAAAKLAEKVKKGGVGVWDTIPMPPNEAVKDEDIRLMLAWILSL
mgnify:CR=1 FL=1